MKNRKLFWLIIYLLFAVDVNGNFWKYYGSGRLNDCILTADSSLVTVGNGFLVMKTNLLGDTIWTRYFPDYTGPMSVNEAISVTETPDHYYLICGYRGNLSTITQRLVKVDAVGNLMWAKNYANGSAKSIDVNHRGSYTMIQNGQTGSNEFYLSELDTAGNIIRQ